MPGGSRIAAGLAALALTATLTACGATADEQDQQPPRQPSIAEQQQVTNPVVESGYRLRIPSLGVDQPLIRLGLSSDGTIAVPPLDQPEAVGVYDRGPKPGEVGPSILLSHINGSGRPGGFARLGELAEGDSIEAVTPQGPVRFEVYKRETYKKNAFNTKAVYSNTDQPELRLITCSGSLDSTGRNYQDNLVIFARKVG